MRQRIQITAEFISGKKVRKEVSSYELLTALRKINHGRR